MIATLITLIIRITIIIVVAIICHTDYLMHANPKKTGERNGLDSDFLRYSGERRGVDHWNYDDLDYRGYKDFWDMFNRNLAFMRSLKEKK